MCFSINGATARGASTGNDVASGLMHLGSTFEEPSSLQMVGRIHILLVPFSLLFCTVFVKIATSTIDDLGAVLYSWPLARDILPAERGSCQTLHGNVSTLRLCPHVSTVTGHHCRSRPRMRFDWPAL